MKNRDSLLGLVLTILVQTTFAQPVDLFNGKDLSGWEVYGTEKWYVEKGLLISESGPDAEYGYLGTKETFKNFELTAEFKQEAEGNSGVFIRSSIDGTKISGWQVEVAPPGNHTGGIYESYGREWLIRPEPEKDKVLKYGKWNKMKIRVVNDKVTSWLNGTQMVTLTDDKIGEGDGIIALQIHSGGSIKIYWKNIQVQRLD